MEQGLMISWKKRHWSPVAKSYVLPRKVSPIFCEKIRRSSEGRTIIFEKIYWHCFRRSINVLDVIWSSKRIFWEIFCKKTSLNFWEKIFSNSLRRSIDPSGRMFFDLLGEDASIFWEKIHRYSGRRLNYLLWQNPLIFWEKINRSLLFTEKIY